MLPLKYNNKKAECQKNLLNFEPESRVLCPIIAMLPQNEGDPDADPPKPNPEPGAPDVEMEENDEENEDENDELTEEGLLHQDLTF